MGDYGEGSYYQQRNGSRLVWFYQAYHTDDAGRTFKIRGTGADKKQARERYNKNLTKRLASNKGRRITGTRLSQAVSLWLDEWAAGRRMAHITREKYRATMESVAADLGDPVLKSINVSAIEGLLEKLETRGVGKSGIANRVRSLNTLFRQCIKHDLLDSNPIDKLDYKMPKSQVAEQDEKMAAAYKRAIEGMMAWAGARGEEIFLPVFIMTRLGLRQSEMLGLEWDSFKGLVRGKNPMVTIDRQLQKSERGEVLHIKKATKTGNERVVPITPEVKKALLKRRSEHRANQNTPEWARDMVFLTQRGRILTQSGLFQLWKDAFEKYWEDEGIKGARRVRPRIHYCRHLFISELQDKGVDLLTIKALAGHSERATTTQDVYIHISDEAKAKAVAAL